MFSNSKSGVTQPKIPTPATFCFSILIHSHLGGVSSPSRARTPPQPQKSKSAVADGKALSLARTQLGHKVSLLIVYAERIIIISHHTKFELANLKR